MGAAWLDHFALREAPLSKEIGDADLWMPPSKVAVCDELHEALEERASVVLTGEPGVGKTCVLRALRHRLLCRVCSMEFADDSGSDLATCPRCGSLNERTKPAYF